MGHLLRGRERTRQPGRLREMAAAKRGRVGVSGLRWLELERGAVDAVAQARGVRRPIGEDVPEVRFAARAAHLGALHEVGTILVLADDLAARWPVEAGPAGAGFEFGRGGKQGS